MVNNSLIEHYYGRCVWSMCGYGGLHYRIFAQLRASFSLSWDEVSVFAMRKKVFHYGLFCKKTLSRPRFPNFIFEYNRGHETFLDITFLNWENISFSFFG